MIYALISNDQVVKFPYYFYELQNENPQVSFPAELSEEMLANYGIVVVYENEIPEFDIGMQTVDQTDCEYNGLNGRWEVSWQVRDLTIEEKESRNSPS